MKVVSVPLSTAAKAALRACVCLWLQSVRDDDDDDARDATSRSRSAKRQTGPGLRQQQQQQEHPHHKGSSVLVEARLSARLSTEFKMLRLGGRMRGFSALLSVLLAGFAAASSDLFDNQLGDINYCKKQCQLTIKNKSPAKVSYCCTL